MASNAHEEAEKLYEQILDLLEELYHVYAQADDSVADDEEGEGGKAWDDGDIVDLLTEEAAERGLEEESAEKVFKAISNLSKKARD